MSASHLNINPSLAKVVERQMRNWELARTQHPVDTAPDAPPVADFVCLSRGVGCPMEDVPGLLAQRLHWPLFDKEILDVMAGEDDLRRRMYETMDERDLSWMEDVLRPLVEPHFSRNDYFHRLTETILTLTRKGSGVFVGRAADLILPRSIGLRVRMIAPRERCVHHLAEVQGWSPEQAQSMLDRLERDRALFIEKHFPKLVPDDSRFDLVINTKEWNADECVNLIESARAIRAARGR